MKAPIWFNEKERQEMGGEGKERRMKGNEG